MIEIEIRAKTQDKSKIIKELTQLGAEDEGTFSQSDSYFKCSHDKERKLVFRIRKKKEKTLLTLKGSSQADTDTAWQEWETEISDSDTLEKLFLSNEYERVVQVDKVRTQYAYNEFEINIDEVKNLGLFVEIEVLSEDVDSAHQKVYSLMDKLGIAKKEIITEGYVPLMMKQNAES